MKKVVAWMIDLWRRSKSFLKKVFSKFNIKSLKHKNMNISSPLLQNAVEQFSPIFIPPKEYGEYLMRTGQWKRNRLRRKLLAKQR